MHVPRPRTRFAERAALGTAAAAMIVAFPGAASAAPPPGVTPILDCYTKNGDGSYTVVLGYTSTHSVTASIAPGSADNYASPARYNDVLPAAFEPGTNHGVFSVTVTAAEVKANASWVLDGHLLNYRDASRASGVCGPDTVMPADGNGSGAAVGLLAAGVVGAVAVSRVRRRVSTAPAGSA